MDEAKTRILLYTVAETCRANQERYRAAAEEVSDSDLRYLFASYASQRARFVEELWRTLGEPPIDANPEESPVARETRRSGNRILTECAAAEREMLRQYEEVLPLDLTDAMRELLERQRAESRTACARLAQLRELARPTPGT